VEKCRRRKKSVKEMVKVIAMVCGEREQK